MSLVPQAVLDLFRCADIIKVRRRRPQEESAAAGSGGRGTGCEERGEERRQERERLNATKALREQYMAALERGDGSTSLSERVKIIKRMVISKGIPDNDLGRKGSTQSMESECSLRGLVWKILLGSIHMDAKLYAQLVGQGASWTDAKIRDDTFRTFRGDEEFRRRVPEDKLYRVNNAFVRLNFPEEADQESGERSGSQGSSEGKGNAEPEGSNGGQKGGGYVQGMTVLCAPLLFVMPEVDAFFCFNSLLTRHMPRYVAANLDGVHEGCALVDRVLAAVDPVLFNYLESKFLTGALYAFPLILSLHACIPPLEEVVKLWDVMFAFGVHLEVLVCVAQCVLLRDKVLRDPNPYQHLNFRNHPPLDAELLVAAAFSLIPHIPPVLLDEIARHPFMD